jgi:hypothetical protein
MVEMAVVVETVVADAKVVVEAGVIQI